MAKVFIPPQMRELTGGVTEVDVTGGNLRQVVAELDAAYPGVAARLRNGDGIAPGLAISIDGVTASRGMLSKVGPHSEIHILPALGGG